MTIGGGGSGTEIFFGRCKSIDSARCVIIAPTHKNGPVENRTYGGGVVNESYDVL